MHKPYCLDVGAEDGEFVIHGMEIDKYCIDPNTMGNKIIVGPKTGTCNFYHYEDDCYDSMRLINSVNFRRHDNNANAEPINTSVQDCITIDDLAKTLEKDFDILKIDAQGCSLEILQGALNQLENICFINCEVEWVELYKDQSLAPEVISFLKSQGFELVGYENHHFGDKQILVWSDLVFINWNNVAEFSNNYGYNPFIKYTMPSEPTFYHKILSKLIPRKPLRKIISFIYTVIYVREAGGSRHRSYSTDN